MEIQEARATVANAARREPVDYGDPTAAALAYADRMRDQNPELAQRITRAARILFDQGEA